MIGGQDRLHTQKDHYSDSSLEKCLNQFEGTRVRYTTLTLPWPMYYAFRYAIATWLETLGMRAHAKMEHSLGEITAGRIINPYSFSQLLTILNRCDMFFNSFAERLQTGTSSTSDTFPKKLLVLTLAPSRYSAMCRIFARLCLFSYSSFANSFVSFKKC